MSAENISTTDSGLAPVAIVGVSCRLPKAENPQAFWRLLSAGDSAISSVPRERPGFAEALGAHDSALKMPGTGRGGFLDGVAEFDAAFFGISPREAVEMDPQQRLMLELSWEALEDSGIVPAKLGGTRTGVFVGASSHDYTTLTSRGGLSAIGQHTATGQNGGVTANRVSYALGLHGPSLVVDSAQSSSLVAVHMACESLRRGETEVAIAGGVNLNLMPDSMVAAAQFGALSPDGECYTFDARANGYVRGEGGGVVVLKSLPAALAAGDSVYCVIPGSAVNHGGASEGLTVPNAGAQEALLRQAYEQAGVAASDVQYVELHGTGTRLGDPIEAEALGRVLGQYRSGWPLLVGSVKTNIGHLEAAAGIAGLVKMALSLRHRLLPGSRNFERPNPAIPLDSLGMQVTTAMSSWPAVGKQLIAGVSSFGMGGTNCHVVLTEHVLRSPGDAATLWSVPAPWLLSARSPEALRDQANVLHRQLSEQPDVGSLDIARSLATTRSSFEYRAALTATDFDGQLAGLEALSTGEPHPNVVRGHTERPGKTAFLFGGQGSQRVGMCSELYRTFSEFATVFDEVVAELDWRSQGESLRDLLFAPAGSPEAALLDETRYTQTSLFAAEVTVAQMLTSWGVTPDLLLGHSIGEIAAAYVADVFSLADACALVTARGSLMQSLPHEGAMVAIEADERETADVLTDVGGAVSVASVNGPRSVVISGDAHAAEAVAEHFRRVGRKIRRLPVSHAFHSHHMDAVLAEFHAVAESITYRPPKIPMVSNVTGELLSAAEACSPDYWVRHVRRPVRYADGMRCLVQEGARVFVDVGPSGALVGASRSCLDADTPSTLVTALHGERSEPQTLLSAVAKLHVDSVPVNWDSVYATSDARVVSLPTYAFQRERQWLGDGMPDTHHGFETVADNDSPEPATDTAAQQDPAFGRRIGELRESDQITAVLDLVLRYTSAILGHTTTDKVGPDLPFRDQGFNSLMTVELCDALSSAVEHPLASTVLFDYPTPSALAEHIRSLLFVQQEPARSPVAATATADEPIAVVGIGCRYPGGVASPDDLWSLVTDEIDAISEFPADRGWNLKQIQDPSDERLEASYVQHGGFLQGATAFDAGFFGISPREALAMDPQQRIVLETAWEAFEHAGVRAVDLADSRTGVFLGAMPQDYGPRLAEPTENLGGYLLTGTTTSVVSGRVSYTFGFQGPAMTVDTACSSSLVSLHLAVQALRTGECDAALAGGVTVMATPGMFVEFSRQRGLAPDGRCKPFAAAADGTSWGEGAGVLLLERLSDARRNRHRVLALVRGTAVNQDGASNGLTAPHGPSQRQVIEAALANAGLDFGDVDAVEAHGTGTKLGDPIEAQALIATYGQNRAAGNPVWLGSLKSNIGHTQAAAGVAGLIKMIMSMRHGVLPRTLHVDEPSRYVDWSSGAVSLLTQAREWHRGEYPRRAAISSFGISGTNAHAIVEESPDKPGLQSEVQAPVSAPQALPWVFSARTYSGVREQVRRLLRHVDRNPELRDVDLCYSLATARSTMTYRAVAVGSDREDVFERLMEFADGRPAPGVTTYATDCAAKVVFVFPGQGAQWVGMTQELLSSAPVFARRMAECAEALSEFVDWDLMDVARGEPGTPDSDRLDVVQPLSFAVMVSLAALWESYGVRPAAVVGHSQGEIAAACVAGALTLNDAARAVALRALALAEVAGKGGMASLALPSEKVTPLLAQWDGLLSIAAVNGPSSTIVSGDAAALQELVTACTEQGTQARLIAVDYASHSAEVECIESNVLSALEPIRPQPAPIPICSSVTGEFTDGTGLTGTYWYRNLRETVHFAQATLTLLEHGHNAFIEVSSHPVVSAAIQDTVEDTSSRAVVLGTLRRGEGGIDRFTTSLGEAHAHGVRVDWSALFEAYDTHLVPLPTYPFEHRTYWTGSDAPPTQGAGDLGLDPMDHPFLRARVDSAADGAVVYTGKVSLETHPWLADHMVLGTVFLPGTAFVEIALSVGEQFGCDDLRDLTIESPLVLEEHIATSVHVTVFDSDREGLRTLTISSRPDGDADELWTTNARGTLRRGEPLLETVEGPGLGHWPPKDADRVELNGLYAALAEKGYHYGPIFQGLHAAWRRGGDVFAEVMLPPIVSTTADQFILHPALLDATLHALGLGPMEDMWNGRLPFSWSGIRVYAHGASAARVHLRATGSDSVRLSLADAAGSPVADIESLVVRPFSPPAIRASQPDEGALHVVDWVEVPQHGIRPAPIESSEVVFYPNVAALADTLLEDEMPPAVVLLSCPQQHNGDQAKAAHETTKWAARQVRAWLADDRFVTSTMAFVTTNAIAVGKTDGVANLTAAPIWGLIRSAQTEHPDRFLLIDLDGTAESLHALPSALTVSEPQMAIRVGTVSIPRLVRDDDAGLLPVPDAQAWCLRSTHAGTLEGLSLVEQPEALSQLREGEVRVSIRAAGMNFKDVVLALGVIDDGALGNEGAGIVLEVGRGVTCFRPGDPVMGVFRGSFGPCAVTDHRMLTRVPAGWSFAQAAAVPIVFSTAFYGLVDLAGLRPGETVLVHAAAGGVGMAATQIARCLGAEVFGTASAAKQELLRANGFDDTHIASSRDTTFEPQFLDQTGGRGIDVVINSLTGVFVDASLRLLSESGRFVEMGKTDIRSPENVAATRADVEYRAFDVIEAGPERIGQMLRKVVNLFEQGELTPLPRQEWDVRRAPEAFRHMEQAKHIGKVVLTVPPARDPEGTVLVTGASGTLGALIARRLVTHHGVRHLLLVSRRGGETPGASELADDLTAVQGTVTFGQCDVADRNSLAQILETVPSAHPLTAVIHAAGIIDDGVVESLDDVRVDQVLRPKIDGAVNLHELTREIPLSTFVLFSSITATLGTPGQANYAAANAFLDALAGHRKTAGLPALSLRWGPWEQRSKMTENLSAADVNRLSQSGLNLLPTADGLELFDSAMASDHVVPAPALLDGKLLRTRQDMVPPMLRGLVRAPRRAPRVTEPTAMSTNSLEQKLAAADRDEQYSTLLELVRTHAAAVLGHSGVDMVRSDKGFKEVGFDSLTAVELRNRLKNATGIHLSATLVFDYPTPGMLAQYLREQLLPDTTADPTTVGVEQVAQLEATLNALVLDEQQRRQVTTRLETLLWKWREVRSPAAEPGEESEIASASHEEIFEMIDKEFGSD